MYFDSCDSADTQLLCTMKMSLKTSLVEITGSMIYIKGVGLYENDKKQKNLPQTFI